MKDLLILFRKVLFKSQAVFSLVRSSRFLILIFLINLLIGNTLQDIALAKSNSDENAQRSDTLMQVTNPPQMYFINDKTYIYQKPGQLDFIKHFPGDLISFTKISFAKKNLVNLAALAALTGILVVADQAITDNTKVFGRKIGLDGNNRMKAAFTVFGQPFEVPHDGDTALYFIGDGWTHTFVAVSFLGYGLIANSNRAVQTASQIAEGMLTTGFTTQLLKHITGRESPYVATVSAGQWRPFPDQIEYHKHVPEYDAFPSGHLATAMMTVTVIAENYPEKKFIRPIGYTLMTILSFEMVNNGVHWFSDYPLALAIGYTLGKIAVARGRKTVDNPYDAEKNKTILGGISFLPYISPQGLGMVVKF